MASWLSILLVIATAAQKQLENDESLRARRLADQKAALEAELAAIEKFGHLDEFLATVKPIADAHPIDQGLQPGIPVADGTMWGLAFSSYSLWHTAAPGRTLARAVDRELEQHPFGAIVDFGRQLREHGVDLLVVTFPSRLELYPELLLDLKSAEGFAGMGIGTVRFLLALNAAGVETLSLNSAFVAARFGEGGDRADQLFLRTDPHWTPRGAELAAKAVADRIAQLPWFVRGPAQLGRAFDVVASTFTHNASVELAAAGAKPELVKANLVQLGGKPIDPVKKNGRIIVMGDSFVQVHRWRGADFCSHLLRFTGHPLDAISVPSGAERACRESLKQRTADEWEGKKLVVWLLPDQDLVVHDRWTPFPIFADSESH